MIFRRKKKRVDSSADLPSDGQLRVQLDQLTASTGSREITRTTFSCVSGVVIA